MAKPDVIVAGHTCLDVIPTLAARETSPVLTDVLAPGQMRQVGPMVLATGGAVPNTGLALHRLGTPVRLVGKVGDDFIGRAILEILRRHEPELAAGMIVEPGVASSYTMILSSPNLDRTFFHYPGPNDTFSAADVPDAALRDGKIFHFGYPPLMRRLYQDGGEALAALLKRAGERGLVTSLDVSQPDLDSEAGRVDWRALLARVLPCVDVFLPGVEETLLMMDPGRYRALMQTAGDEGLLSLVEGTLLCDLADEVLALGPAVVGLKLGDQGIYLRTTADHDQLRKLETMLPLAHRPWLNRELLAPAFAANLVGTTGAGDCAVAGFLTGLVRGLDPDAALISASAVGASNVEAADAVSGVPPWADVQQRIAAGWDQIPTRLHLRGWGQETERGLWVGPRDRGGLIA
jgi:sugar/nucleoside kinase (ribokinase family)